MVDVAVVEVVGVVVVEGWRVTAYKPAATIMMMTITAIETVATLLIPCFSLEIRRIFTLSKKPCLKVLLP